MAGRYIYVTLKPMFKGQQGGQANIAPDPGKLGQCPPEKYRFFQVFWLLYTIWYATVQPCTLPCNRVRYRAAVCATLQPCSRLAVLHHLVRSTLNLRILSHSMAISSNKE